MDDGSSYEIKGMVNNIALIDLGNYGTVGRYSIIATTPLMYSATLIVS